MHTRPVNLLAVVHQVHTGIIRGYEQLARITTILLVSELYKYLHSQLGNSPCKIEETQQTYRVAKD